MNNTILMNLTLMICALLSGTGSNAQTQSPRAGMPVSLSIAQEGLILNASMPSRVNVRALRHFNKTFAGRKADWYDTDKVFQAKLSNDSVRTVVGYSKQGRWLYTINHYSEKQMPAEMRHVVKSEYYDYSIDLINEVKTPSNRNKVYLIHIQNHLKHHKLLRFSDQGLEVIKTYFEN